METGEALKIVRALADGVDPYSAEKLPLSSVYQHPDTARALYVAVRMMEKAENYKRRAALPDNAGKAWSQEEEQRLITGFESGSSTQELARLHGRTQFAIEARLFKMGKIDEASFSQAAQGREEAVNAASESTAF